jgi:hypothetical protein
MGDWMLLDHDLPNCPKKGEKAHPFASGSGETHDLVVVYNSGEGKWDVQAYSQEEHETFYAADMTPEAGLAQLVFIRGFISPSWVSTIGSKYSIDPEFFRRHMEYLSTSVYRHAYSLPSLASSSNNIYRLCVSTLLHRDGFNEQDLQSQRSEQSIELGKYKTQQLGSTKVRCGDSLVREYSTLCSCFSVIEQWISLCVTRTDKGWAGKRSCHMKREVLADMNPVLAWMDQGRPLEKSPAGPWTSHIESKATALPIIQQHHKMAFRTTTNRLDAHACSSIEVQQSTAILPLQYDSLMGLVDLSRRAAQDPLSMCIPLFAHAAFSEVQFLNLMESRIRMQIDAVAGGVSADALRTFQYFSTILDRHARQLTESIRAFCKLMDQSNQGSDGVRAESPMPRTAAPRSIGVHRQTPEAETPRNTGSSSPVTAFTAKALWGDFEQLHDRCVELSRMCTQGINLAMNNAAIEESRKAIEQSERLKKLTLLATFFIPLTFSTSLFGMNVDLLGQEGVRFWWFFVLCVPITLSAYILYAWDSQLLKRYWGRFWKGFRCVGRNKAVERSRKDTNDII